VPVQHPTGPPTSRLLPSKWKEQRTSGLSPVIGAMACFGSNKMPTQVAGLFRDSRAHTNTPQAAGRPEALLMLADEAGAAPCEGLRI
jgi:hypothetical protein